MKTIEILEWIIKESINGEFLNIIDVPEEGEETFEQNEEWWLNTFGGVPPHPVKPGQYLYFYISSFRSGFGEDYMYPDFSIELPDASMTFGTDYINFYRIEDGKVNTDWLKKS